MKKIRQGFTLIELIIVLAIAGLIISLVFIAASAAQRNGRDTTRRADAQKLATAIEQYAANKNGQLPQTEAELNTLTSAGYLNAAKFKDPSTGNTYTTLMRDRAGVNFIYPGIVYYVPDSVTAPTSYSIIMSLEDGKKFEYTP